MFTHNLDDKIENVYDLYHAVQDVGNWKGLCFNLRVDDATMNRIDLSDEHDANKKIDCLRAYIDGGEASWPSVVQAVAKPPISNKLLAKKIAKDRGVNYDSVMKDEL